MERWIVALVMGLLGGAAGALAVEVLRGSPAASVSDPASEEGLLRDILARIERIEAGEATPTLVGRVDPTAAPAAEAARATAETLRRIEEKVTALDEKVAAVAAKPGEGEERPKAGRPRKKRVTLADAASEIGLSRAEEADLRRIYEETYEKAITLLAQPDGDPAAIRREIEEGMKSDRTRTAVTLKYAPKMLNKLGDFLALESERRTRIEQAVGAEKAERLEGMDVVEANPLGLGGSMNVEARAR